MQILKIYAERGGAWNNYAGHTRRKVQLAAEEFCGKNHHSSISEDSIHVCGLSLFGLETIQFSLAGYLNFREGVHLMYEII
jgi:hypothetical protein